MNTLITRIMPTLFLAITASSAANAGYVPDIRGTYESSDGSVTTIKQYQKHIRLNYRIGSDTVSMQAEHMAWTVMQPNGVVVERTGFIGTFRTQLANGKHFGGTAHILQTNQRGVLEIQSTYVQNGQPIHSEPYRIARVSHAPASPSTNGIVKNQTTPATRPVSVAQPSTQHESEAEAILKSLGL